MVMEYTRLIVQIPDRPGECYSVPFMIDARPINQFSKLKEG